MRFWDSSAVVPLLVGEAASDDMTAEYLRDPEMVVWWATTVECVSALARLERDGVLEPPSMATAIQRLNSLDGAWREVQPTARVRQIAIRLLRVHGVRAADALQLSAALAAAEDHPASLELVTLDHRLGRAAEREGFTVIGAAAA